MKIPATIARLFGRRDVDERRTMFMERRSEWVQASAQAPEHRGSEMAVGEGDSCRYSFLGVGLAVCLYNNPEYGSWDPPELQGNKLVWSAGSNEDTIAALGHYYGIFPAWVSLVDDLRAKGESCEDLGEAMINMPIYPRRSEE